MNAPHTAGPWEVVNGSTTGKMVTAPSEPKVRRNVAAVGGPRREANARLIAAAPDLLEELEQQADGTSTIIALLADQPGPVAASLRGMLSMQEQAARAAIALATQVQP